MYWIYEAEENELLSDDSNLSSTIFDTITPLVLRINLYPNKYIYQIPGTEYEIITKDNGTVTVFFPDDKNVSNTIFYMDNFSLQSSEISRTFRNIVERRGIDITKDEFIYLLYDKIKHKRPIRKMRGNRISTERISRDSVLKSDTILIKEKIIESTQIPIPSIGESISTSILINMIPMIKKVEKLNNSNTYYNISTKDGGLIKILSVNPFVSIKKINSNIATIIDNYMSGQKSPLSASDFESIIHILEVE